ncbi:MAG TPA: hypothetical protein VLH15_10430 [Dehalococcoidales bacterium]|nr:hypothetical protein [Dehalococcoidales bacterium]
MTLKYSDCIITDARPKPADVEKLYSAQLRWNKSTLEFSHILNVNGDRIKDFFHVDCTWLWGGSSEGPIDENHAHDFGEVIGFVGSSREDPHNLNGEIRLMIDDQEIRLTKSCLIFVPPGVMHGPVLNMRIDKPVFFVTIALTGRYSRQSIPVNGPEQPRKESFSIVYDTKTRFTVAATDKNAPPPIPRDPSLRSTRLLHLEDDIAQGSFYVDFVWIWEGNGGAPAPEHAHDWVELIAMVGGDREHPYDLGGTMSIVLGDETHYMTRSSLVCVPRGLKHCPWKFIGIKKPTLVFTAGPSAMYSGSHKKD